MLTMRYKDGSVDLDESFEGSAVAAMGDNSLPGILRVRQRRDTKADKADLVDTE